MGLPTQYKNLPKRILEAGDYRCAGALAKIVHHDNHLTLGPVCLRIGNCKMR